MPEAEAVEKTLADILHCWHSHPMILSDVEIDADNAVLAYRREGTNVDEKAARVAVAAIMALAEQGARMEVEAGGYRFSRE